MKNKFLKITLIIAFAVMLFAIPNVADAATYDIYTYEVDGNEITITDCQTSASGAIAIPSEIEGKKVTSIGDDAFYGCRSLTSITIPESVTSIGEKAFYKCTSLTSITIPDSVTSIGNYSFYNCTSLTSITIPESVTSIGERAFYDCTSLTSITIPESVTSIGGSVFNGCTSLTSITIPESVTSIGEMAFYICTSLTSITIPESVTSIGGSAFYGCTSLTSITIPESVTSIGSSAFRGCTSLEEITLPFVGAKRGITGTVGSVFGYIFGYSTSSQNGTTRQYYSDSGLAYYYIPSTLKKVTITDETIIPYGAFYNCSNLISITIPESVTSIESYAFFNCNNIKGVYISDIDAWCEIEFGNSSANPLCYGKNLYLDGNLVTEVELSDSATKISSYAFYNCTPLASITISESVTSIGNDAFYGCTSLTSITIPESVTSIGYNAFRGCTSLTSITIPESVTSIGYAAFYGCTSLTSITIPDSVTSIGKDAFYDTAFYNDSSNWTDGVLYIGNHLIDAKTSISGEHIIKSGTICIESYAFEGCTSLTSITIPDSVTSIGNSAFSGCTSLTSITIPESVTSIGSSAFSGCTSLEEITLPFVGAKRGITGTVDSVFGYIFGYTTSSGSGTTCQYYSDSESVYYYIPSTLKKVTITDETVVPYGAFYGCVNLTDVIIDGNPTAIMAKAFMGHENLWNITIKSKNVRFANGQMFNVTDMPTIYGYAGSTTEAYAEKYGLWFEVLGEEESGKYTLDADAVLVNGKIVIDITTDKPVTDQALHVALYNDASKLVDYIIVPLNKAYNSFNVVFKDEDNSSFAKVFLWDGLESMTPVAQAKTVTIKNK